MRGFSLLVILSLSAGCACNQRIKSAERYYRSGLDKNAAGDLDGAILEYDKAINIYPRYWDAYVSRGLARKNKGDLDGAIADYDKAIETNSALKEAYNNRGLVRQLKGETEGAIADFNKAVAIDPDFAEAYFNRANTFIAKGDLAEAVVDLTKAIENHGNPYLSESYNNRGNIRLKMGDTLGGIADFTTAIDIAPQNIYAYANRGYALTLLGNDSEARNDFDELMMIDSSLKSAIDETIKKAKAERERRLRRTDR